LVFAVFLKANIGRVFIMSFSGKDSQVFFYFSDSFRWGL